MTSRMRADHVRQRRVCRQVGGFEPLQQEQMVLQYVEKHGRITRREAAELCQLGIRQAGRLLARLTRQGKITLHGTRKGAWYGPRSQI